MATPPESGSGPEGGRPVVVTGMHRSGTSLVGSMLRSAGIAMGDRRLAADAHNPRGYFEDVDFLSLQRRMLSTATRDGDGGHRDWGWTESETLDEAAFLPFADEARALLAARTDGPRWGWKDPRTTVLLDFWRPLLPAACYVLVYRHPWGVADSMQRLGADIFLRHADYAYRIWQFYNERLLRFRRANRERTLLLSADELARDPSRLLPLLAAKLRIDGQRSVAEPAPQPLFEAELFHSLRPTDPLVSLVAATRPRCVELLAALDEEAELSGRDTWCAAPLSAKDAAVPRVSVVVPCFDQGEMMLEAVASVERAVAEPYELVIVNDGSQELRTLEVLGALRTAGYRVLDQDNRGLAAARNRGIEEARAPYVLPLDADNRLREGFVGPALQLLDARPRAGVVYGDRFEFGLRNGRVHVPTFELPKILAGNFIDACALIRKETWRESGGFDGGMPEPGWEDWDLWIGAAAHGWSFEHLPVVAFDYRVRPASMITAFENPELRRRLLAYVVAKHRPVFLEHLDELVFVAQSSSGEISRLARLFGAAQRVVEGRDEIRVQGGEQVAELVRTRREGVDLAAQNAEIGSLAALWDDAQRDRIGLRAEREGLYSEREALLRELAAWQERVRAMEASRAWRLRARLLALLRRLHVAATEPQPNGRG